MKKSRWISTKAIVIIGIIFLTNGTVLFIPAQPHVVNENIDCSCFPLVDERVADILFDQKISFLMRLGGFPSLSACIIKDDVLIWANSYGYYNLSGQKPASSDTIYLLASITKTIVGTALMQLYEQGFFNLDDDVNLFLPFDLRNPYFPDDPITFRMLLSHTSSLNVNTQMDYYWFNFSVDPPFDFFPDPYLKEFLLPNGRYYDESVWSDTYKPGEHAMYANVGFDLILYLVEIISNESFIDYCDTNIFHPLNMYNTSFNLSTLDIDNVAIPYQRIMGRYYTINELGFLFDEYTPSEKFWKMRSYPAGGLYSTVSDLSTFLIAHMNDGLYQDVRILEKETVQLMHEMQPENNIGYGLAWMHINIGRGILASGHGGDIYGIDTWMLYHAKDDIGVIYLANGNPAYGVLPLRGWIITQLILYLLFTKEGFLTYENQCENDLPDTVLRSLCLPSEFS
ncbi:MAG: serine hydrolase [Candidatus Thermoplasmatota archaeon]|nr:serine hydrolase [Candidatus Thermoplasmatota archaeon]